MAGKSDLINLNWVYLGLITTRDMFQNVFDDYFFGLNSILASSYLSRGCLDKIRLYWAKNGPIINKSKFKTSFESHSLSLASFVCWSKLYYSSFILVIWLFKLNKMKLG